MNRRHLLQSLALTAFATLISAAPVSAADIGTKLKDGKRLSVGETSQYDDGGLKITFLAVKKDFRCPINAQCLTAGDATVILRVKAGKEPVKEVTIHTNRKPNYVTIPAYHQTDGTITLQKSYWIKIDSLTPLPYAGKKTLQSDYRLKLKIGIVI